VRDLLSFLIDNIGDEINVFAGHPLIGISGRVNAEGIGALIKTAIKFAG
jgi:hypothetical protein